MENLNSSSLLTLVGLALLVGVIYIPIIQAVFKINVRTRYQKATVWLLIKMAKQQGVLTDDLKDIMEQYRIATLKKFKSFKEQVDEMMPLESILKRG